LTASGSATSEGFLNRTVDGQFLVMAGYDAAPGTTGITTSTSITTNRVIGRIDANGTIDTTTALTDALSGGNPRSVISVDGTSFWLTGTGNLGVGGIWYATLGATTATQLSIGNNNLRVVNIFGSQLYASTSSGNSVRVGTVGSGTPTSGSPTYSNLPGFPTTGSPYGFVFFDLSDSVAGVDTLYVADDGSGQGITKWSFNGTDWAQNNLIQLTAVRGLAGKLVGSNVVLYFTVNGNKLQTMTDTAGYNANNNGTATNLADAAVNTAFRGVAFVPVSIPATPTATATATETSTATATPTDTATATQTNAETATQTDTATSTATATPTATPTETSTATATPTDTATATPTLTSTATNTASNTATASATATATLTHTATATATATATLTASPTATETATHTATVTWTYTPSNTPTTTPTPPPPAPDTIGVFKGGRWYLRFSNTAGGANLAPLFGNPNDLPVVGDWNNDGIDTLGVFQPMTGRFVLSDSNTAPGADYTFIFGNPADQPIAGKWDATMSGTGVGVYRSSNGIVYLKKAFTTGFSDYFLIFGNPGDQPVAGDWDGNGLDGIGIYRSNSQSWYLKNDAAVAGITYADIAFGWAIATNKPLAGDWNADRQATVGFLTDSGVVVLHGTNDTLAVDTVFAYGPTGSIPVAGKWTAPLTGPISGVFGGSAGGKSTPVNAGNPGGKFD
jgi:hypothetical protein